MTDDLAITIEGVPKRFVEMVGHDAMQGVFHLFRLRPADLGLRQVKTGDDTFTIRIEALTQHGRIALDCIGVRSYRCQRSITNVRPRLN